MRGSYRSVSQPDAIVPATSKSPTSASRLAATVIGMPWSCAAGMKCVPIRPLVVAPQMAKLPASSQKTRVRDASTRARTATAALLPERAGRCGPGSSAVAPNACSPTSCGWSRISNRTSGTTARAATATVTEAGRHPWCSVSAARIGRKISCPVAFAAVRMPLTRPRRATNHRVETVATNAMDIDPVPMPTSSPQHSSSCQLAVMNTVNPLPAATSSSATVTTGRMPKRSMSAAANGDINPNNVMLIDMAEPTVACDQPNSMCSGSISTLGTDRNAAAPSMVTNVTAAMIQAWCTTRRRADFGGGTTRSGSAGASAGVGVTRSSSGSEAADTSGRTAHM